MKNYRDTEAPSMDCNPTSTPIAAVPNRNPNPNLNLLASGGQRTARPTLPVAALGFQGTGLLIASLAALLLASPPGAFAADTTDSLLQKGLFEEEANHNFPEAIKAYEAVVAQTDQQRKLAATAIFRLGECYRKLGKTNEAATYYQRVVRDFADQELLVKFSRQLLGQGRTAPTTAATTLDAFHGLPRIDPESDRIRALAATFRDNPDLVNAPDGSLRTPLHEAAQQGQSRVVAFLLTNGAHLEVRDNSGQTPLLVATRTGSKDVVEQLLRAKANPNTADAGGATPAHFAAHQAMRGILELLIQAGANVNARGHFRHDGNFATESTPLHIAAGRGYRSVAELLIDSKADVNARDSRGQTPLHTASILGQDPVCELLLKRGANINAADNSQRTALHSAAKQHFSIVEALLKESAEINARDSGGWTPLFLAVENRQAEIVQRLLKNKAEVNVTGRGETPLLIAVRLKAIDIAELLLEAGADVNARNTAQGYAVINAAAEELRMLGVVLKFKPDLEARNSNGYTPLLDAVANGRVETVKLLLEAGADPNNAYLREGATPLHFAASKGFTDIAALLLAHKADPNIVNAHGRTAFDNVGASMAGYFRPPPPLPAQFPGAPTVSGQVPARVARAPSPDPVAADADKLRELLLKHGADTNIARRGVIAVTRNDRSDWVPSRWFSRETHPHNRFTLFELIASFYDSQVNPNTTLVFPDLQRLRILRLGTNGANEEFQLNVAALLREGDCSKDIWLQWGDVVSIPEQEHRLNESWQGFDSAFLDSLSNCLRRTVHIVVKGKTNELTRGSHRVGSPFGKPGGAQFWLSQILYNSALLLSTSDTSRVKVYRTDPITKEKLELNFDYSRSPYPSDLWLRHGDVIEVPEKTAATAKADQP